LEETQHYKNNQTNKDVANTTKTQLNKTIINTKSESHTVLLSSSPSKSVIFTKSCVTAREEISSLQVNVGKSQEEKRKKEKKN
jgi:hypothetical protein